MKCFLQRLAFYTPGVDDWDAAQKIFQGQRTYKKNEAEQKYKPVSLERNEARRATSITRLAFRLVESIASDEEIDLSKIGSVFASSGGDYEIFHKTCEILTTDQKYISPTDFHNSVHNAPSGYWSIASQSHLSSISVAGFDHTFSQALVEAIIHITVEQRPVLLVCYDIAPDYPIREQRKITSPFGVAMLLSEKSCKKDLAEFSIHVEQVKKPTDLENKSFCDLLNENPIARSLPLLESIALNRTSRIALEGTPGVVVDVKCL